MPQLMQIPMDPRLEEILTTLPPIVAKSRLEPYRAFVLRLRRDGRTYREIKKILADQCKVRISLNALYKFTKGRRRPRIAVNPESPQPDPVRRESLEREELPKPRRRCTQEEIEAMRAKARASAHKPTTEPRRPPVFHYDPTRPLTNRPRDDKETNR
jgi:hypothetical protein